MIKAVLFDMDGTVLDTENMYREAWRGAFERTEHEFSEELFNKCIGLPISVMEKLVNDSYGVSGVFEETFQTAAAIATKHKKTHGVPIKAGFYELSDFLKERGIKSVVATSTEHDTAVKDLTESGIISRFIGVIGGDDVKNGKPAPDPYVRAAELAGVPTENCIAIEDSVNGIRSAAAAGVRCVYIKDVVDIPPEIEELVFKKANSLDEVIGIIDNM